MARWRSFSLASVLAALLLSGCVQPVPSDSPADGRAAPPSSPPASGNASFLPHMDADGRALPAQRLGRIVASLRTEAGDPRLFHLSAAFLDARGQATAPRQANWTATSTPLGDQAQPEASPTVAGEGSDLPASFRAVWSAPGTYRVTVVLKATGFRDASVALDVRQDAPPPESGSGEGSGAQPNDEPRLGSTAVELRHAPPGVAPTQVLFDLAATFRDADGNATTISQPRWTATQALVVDEQGRPVATPVFRPVDFGGALPAAFNVTWGSPGTYAVVAKVDAPGHAAGSARVEVVVPEPPPPPPPPPPPILFQDGGEAGVGQWSMDGATFFTNAIPLSLPAPLSPSPVSWAPTTARARSGSSAWTAPYYTGYDAHMTSIPISIPNDGKQHELSFWLTGGVENNPNPQYFDVDGLHIFFQTAAGRSARLLYVLDDFPQWTRFTVPITAGQPIQLVFQFRTDLGCSAGDTQQGRDLVFGTIFGGCDPSSYTGYFIDDIEVT